jgi:antitoxin component of RelBE/YafQ-DinJ toxin-antitoxin module
MQCKEVKMSSDAQITFRTDSEVRSELEEMARGMGKKLSQLMNEMSRDYIKQQKERRNDELAALRDVVQKLDEKVIYLQQNQEEMAKKLSA